ncbi:MAG: ketoacyl-ACP synthase III [Candidatus Methylomirabilis sp.]|nr:ketoacyl-ACP synthase III [Deltaproteobacteria bacterium]
MNGRIAGAGRYVPPRVVTNDELAKIIDSSDEWIRQRTGIEERHYVDEGVSGAEMSEYAARMALENAKRNVSDVDCILYATLSPDYFFPGTGVFLQARLGLEGVPAYDIRNQCSGFMYELEMANAFIRSGQYRCVLVVGCEIHSTGVEMAPRGRDVTAIFGDGAGAVVVVPSEEEGCGILSTHLHADGRFAKDLWLECGASVYHPRITHEMIDEGRVWPKMNGKLVFKHAVEKVPEVILEGLKQNGLRVEDMKLLIPHQANLRINQFAASQLNLRDDQVFNNIQKYGNTTAASIPIALSEALDEGRIARGDIVVFAGLGAGFTWGSVVVRW